MFDRRRIVVIALLLTLCLAPGLALAGQRGHSAANADQSPFELLMTWIERAWDSVSGETPQGRHVNVKAGCGIDPNGCPTGGGAGGGGTTNGTTGTGGH